MRFAPQISDLEREINDNFVRGQSEIEHLANRVTHLEDPERLRDTIHPIVRDFVDEHLRPLPQYVQSQMERFSPQADLDTAVEYWSTTFDRMESTLLSQIKDLKAELEKVKASHLASSSSSSATKVQVIPPPMHTLPPPPPTCVQPPPMSHDAPGKGMDETFSSDTTIPYQPETSAHGNTVVFHSGGNLPVPKFVPHLDSPENFMRELELYMKRKRVMSEDWVLMLPTIFNQDKHQSLWWQSTKLSVSSWLDFKHEFFRMYGSTVNKHQALERLLNRRQRHSEPFSTFAFEMNMAYRKIFEPSPDADVIPILQFIAERALPHLKSHLLSCRSSNFEMVNFGKLFESERAQSYSSNKVTTSHSAPNSSSSPKPHSSKPSTSSNSDHRGKSSDSKRVRRVCSKCPGKNNHDDAHCFKLHPPPKQQGKVAQVVNSASGNDEEK
ncbi:Activity-regulated cytoskeleton-associated protein [Folsomia candida]|uniref:Activity-regulated cytoskeleton-associated protein n=1 Tax=Folsomia candida TaxID=158441 RepID=A0A226CW67_FOLCA|nr:Activity-regulated cytoskeleton-associated protein [Folsomia candida]